MHEILPTRKRMANSIPVRYRHLLEEEPDPVSLAVRPGARGLALFSTPQAGFAAASWSASFTSGDGSSAASSAFDFAFALGFALALPFFGAMVRRRPEKPPTPPRCRLLEPWPGMLNIVVLKKAYTAGLARFRLCRHRSLKVCIHFSSFFNVNVFAIY